MRLASRPPSPDATCAPPPAPPSPEPGIGAAHGVVEAWPERLGFGRVEAWRERLGFGRVEAFCVLIGYPRSGHSLVGALLDAHPEAVIAHESDALALSAQRMGRRDLYRRILRNAWEFAATGAKPRPGYEFMAPGGCRDDCRPQQT